MRPRWLRKKAFGVAGFLLVSLFVFKAEASRLWSETAPRQTRGLQTLPEFVELSSELVPTVVSIAIESEKGSHLSTFWSFDSASPFEELPPPGHGLPQGDVHSLGCGFIIDKQGFIVTNQHVVAEPGRIVVTTQDGEQYKAKIIGQDEKSDIALLKINANRPLRYAPLGDSDKLKVGEWVLAIGNPFGFDHSVTVGIVSAVDRVIPGSYGKFIQTDASINPGNSGGPLINTRGEVVGVNSEIYTRSGSNIGIGFAIPVNLVKSELDQLERFGYVSHGWLGVYLQDVTEELEQALGTHNTHGALVADLVPDSPASRAGVKRGDIILAYDGRPVANSLMLPVMVGETPAGRQVRLTVMRDGKVRELKVTIDAAKEASSPKQAPPVTPRKSAAQRDLGLEVEALPPEWLHKVRRYDARGGVIVTNVTPGSPAEEAGLHRRDVILEVDRQPVTDLESYQQAVKTAHGKPAVLLLVVRGQNTMFLALKP